MDGRLVCVMDWATFTTFCSFLWSWAEKEPYQAVIHPERMLSVDQGIRILNLMISHDQNEWWSRLEGPNGLLLPLVSMFPPSKVLLKS